MASNVADIETKCLPHGSLEVTATQAGSNDTCPEARCSRRVHGITKIGQLRHMYPQIFIACCYIINWKYYNGVELRGYT